MNSNLIKIKKVCLAFLLVCVHSIPFASYGQNKTVLSNESLMDKIKGGWAGQTIGVTYGGPTEYQYVGITIPDSVNLPWYEGYLKETMIKVPGLFDDLYMDLTFLDVFDKYGLNVSVDSLANRFAYADFPLDQANQAARYNIVQGMKAPQSGYWKNNPHADDIDFQIEADFIGLMSPGMPNSAAKIADKVGHIMCYGDGYYGGVYVANMYALSFTQSDIKEVVKDALRGIPVKSQFYQCINDVINWYQEDPSNWRSAWNKLEAKWNNDLCPDGAHAIFNIDAKMNSAYIIIGLLYGEGDFGRTIDIATRCGQDSDCNPSSAGGILGTLLGYKSIPSHWKLGTREIEDLNFQYTDISLNKAYTMTLNLAKQQIKKNGGKVLENAVEIKNQKIKPVKFEQSFAGLDAFERKEIWGEIKDTASIDFKGTGIVWRGDVKKIDASSPDYTFLIEVTVDGVKKETFEMPTDNLKRRRDLYWNFDLKPGVHKVELKVLNPNDKYKINNLTYVSYDKK